MPRRAKTGKISSNLFTDLLSDSSSTEVTESSREKGLNDLSEKSLEVSMDILRSKASFTRGISQNGAYYNNTCIVCATGMSNTRNKGIYSYM